MPFDATTLDYQSPLSQIVLEPLSREVVEKYKQDVANAFMAESIIQKRLYEMRVARWRTDRYNSNNDKSIKVWLRRFHAPRPVISLAKRIHAEVPEAKFSLQWFYKDPVLDIYYGDKVMHLAIWDKELVAIAKTEPSRWAKLIHTIWDRR